LYENPDYGHESERENEEREKQKRRTVCALELLHEVRD